MDGSRRHQAGDYKLKEMHPKGASLFILGWIGTENFKSGKLPNSAQVEREAFKLPKAQNISDFWGIGTGEIIHKDAIAARNQGIKSPDVVDAI